MKNTHYSNHSLIVEGDKLFRSGNFEVALTKFKEYLGQFPQFRKFVLGSIGITLLKLQRFNEAKTVIIEAIKLSKEREKEYSIFLAECYNGLGEYKQAINYCNNYINTYGQSSEIESILGEVLPSKEYSLLLENFDLNFNETSCAGAFMDISKKYFKSGDFDEAEYYANMRLNYSDLDVIEGYYLLGSIYKETQEYYKCGSLLQKLKESEISNREKASANTFLLEIYKNSLCYPLSELSHKDSKLAGMIEIFAKIIEELNLNKLKTIFETYKPSLNLIEHFDYEVKFQMVRI